ncbi:uncharacterized protein [Miscanthus floridulus]|uniref:uncharacterized protein n=1 Tax=Miscanthus floridulus TaxID=154761 RepID=UPI0034589AAD
MATDWSGSHGRCKLVAEECVGVTRIPRHGKASKQSYGRMTGNAFDPLPMPSCVPVPMYFCGDPCKVAKFDEEDTYRQRYWMCANFVFEPTLRQRRINKMTPPPLCDFEQWIDTEIKPEDKEWMQKLLRWETEDKEMMEKRRREEALEKEHKEKEERRRVASHREERERKLERAQRTKAAGQSRCPEEGKVASLYSVVFITC